jgi:pyruvate dehydrogenase E2 component (dihydrolipoamide acetyltransferase)
MALTPVYMPKFGMTMTEGLITQWHVAEGAAVRQGDLLFSVETEKATADVEAPIDGTLVEISAPADTEASVGAVVAYIDTSD